MSEFFKADNLAQKDVLEGVRLRAVAGKSAMMTFFEFDQGAVIPSHRHPHEQITYVLEGELAFTVEGVTRSIGRGGGVVINADQEHSARVVEGPARALDAWYPIRDDYL